MTARTAPVGEIGRETPAARRVATGLVAAWGAGLALLFALVAAVTLPEMLRARGAALAEHRAWLDPRAPDPGHTPPDTTVVPNARTLRIRSGVYVDRVQELSTTDMYWLVDFDVWFRWSDDRVRPDSDFEVVDGWIESREREAEYVGGGERYDLYHVLAHITKVFDATRFPSDDHLLTIAIEEPAWRRDEAVFVPDSADSRISSRARFPGYEVRRAVVLEVPHTYRTSRGDPRLAPGAPTTYSQLRYGIWIERTGRGIYARLFQALYVSVAVALLALVVDIRYENTRMTLGVGALFGAVANAYLVAAQVPASAGMTLADMLNGVGVLVILLTVLHSAAAMRLARRHGTAAGVRRLDRVALAVLLVGFVALNVALPYAATLRR